MSTCSPVTLRTTSGPVTKMRPAPLMIDDVGQRRAVGGTTGRRPEHDGDLGNPTGGPHHGSEDLTDRVERDHTLGQACTARVPQADHGHPLAYGEVDRLDDVLAPSVPIAPPIRVASVAKAMTGVPSI